MKALILAGGKGTRDALIREFRYKNLTLWVKDYSYLASFVSRI